VLLAGLEQQQHSLIMQLWHLHARIKADAVAQYVSDLLLEMSDPDDKFLVFAYHRCVGGAAGGSGQRQWREQLGGHAG